MTYKPTRAAWLGVHPCQWCKDPAEKTDDLCDKCLRECDRCLREYAKEEAAHQEKGRR